MQTFLPYPDFAASARVLDYRRLGKQRVECLQILKVLNGETTAWKNHPAVKMWEGYTDALKEYGAAMCREWLSLGYKDNCLKYFLHENTTVLLPWWIGYEPFHSSHRANLLRKDTRYYSKYQWTEDPNTEYVWPTKIPLDK